MYRIISSNTLKMTEQSARSAGVSLKLQDSKAEDKLLVEERKQKLKVLADHKEIVKKIVTEKTTFFQNLIMEVNTVSDKFEQFKVWRNRYTESNSGNPNTFLMAFTELDRRIELLSQIFVSYDAKLIQASDDLQEYFRCMNQQFTKIQDTVLRFTNASMSMKELQAVWTPTNDWFKTVPDPKLEDLADEWKRLQLQPKLTQCFRQMQSIIRFVASNGDYC